MSQVLFDSAFSATASPIRRQYGVSDADLCGMVSAAFYKDLDNPAVTGPKSMLASLEKEEGISSQERETDAELRERRSVEHEARVLALTERRDNNQTLFGTGDMDCEQN